MLDSKRSSLKLNYASDTIREIDEIPTSLTLATDRLAPKRVSH